MSLFAVLVIFLAGVNCIDRQKVAVTPKPAFNFDLQAWAQDDWYIQARYLPCSFSGSRSFTDIVIKRQVDGDIVRKQMIWRDGLCTSFNTRIRENGKPGVYIQEDPLGGMTTGDNIVVVFQYKKGYHISWGCTKKGVDGRTCKDAWIMVKTRKPFPAKYVWECIAKDLKRLWKLSLTEMDMVSHNNPC